MAPCRSTVYSHSTILLHHCSVLTCIQTTLKQGCTVNSNHTCTNTTAICSTQARTVNGQHLDLHYIWNTAAQFNPLLSSMCELHTKVQSSAITDTRAWTHTNKLWYIKSTFQLLSNMYNSQHRDITYKFYGRCNGLASANSLPKALTVIMSG